MDGRTVSGKQSLWQRRIRAQASSGMSVAAFCRRESISQASFYYWKRRVAAEGLKKSSECGERPATFVQLPMSATTQANHWVEITARDGVVVRVPASCQTALETSLRVLTQTQPECREGHHRA